MTKLQLMEQIGRALQLIAQNLDDETAIEVAGVFEPWKADKSYTVNKYVTYGKNSVGDPQLYRVIQAHTSQDDWTPDVTPSLFTAIGLDKAGYPVWSQPTGAADAYNIGDIVNYNGTLYRSLIDGNTWSPETYPTGWEAVE